MQTTTKRKTANIHILQLLTSANNKDAKRRMKGRATWAVATLTREHVVIRIVTVNVNGFECRNGRVVSFSV